MSTTLLAYQDIVRAKALIDPFIVDTRLLHSRFLSELAGAQVWLKLENEQPTGSFKIRGALSKIGSLTPEDRARGVVTASAGNHGLGVAYASDCFQVSQVNIFVPRNASASKLEGLKRFQAGVHTVGSTYEHAHHAAMKFAQQEGAVYIPAYNDRRVIAGQGTIGLEIMTAQPKATLVLIPVGGGGLLAGVTTAAIGITNGCRIVGVQAEASPSAYLSLRDGRAYDPFDHSETIADGLAGGFGELPFDLVRTRVERIALAGENEMRRAIHVLLIQEGLTIEASGAVSIVPLLNGSVEVAGETVVCILSGGNISDRLLGEIVAEFSA